MTFKDIEKMDVKKIKKEILKRHKEIELLIFEQKALTKELSRKIGEEKTIKFLRENFII